MAFTTQEYRDFIRLLSEHPEWQDELRRMLLAQELLNLPQTVTALFDSHRRVEEELRALAESQRHTDELLKALIESQRKADERIERLETAIAQLIESDRQIREELKALAEAQHKADERIERLETTVAQLIESQRNLEERVARLETAVAQLIESQRNLEERVARLESAVTYLIEAQRQMSEEMRALAASHRHLELKVQRLTDRMARLDGQMLEIQYRNKAASYFGRLLRRAQAVELNDLEERLENVLSPEELEDVLRLDLVIRGRSRQAPSGETAPELWLAVEVSAVIDRQDVKRAFERAEILRKAGLAVLPVVAGEKSTAGARELAKEKRVVVVKDGSMEFAHEAVEYYLGSGSEN